MGSSQLGWATVTAQRPQLVRAEPMLLVDDDRCCVDANAAACLLLRLPRDAVRALRIDDLLDADVRDSIDALWYRFLANGHARQRSRARPWKLRMPDGARITVDVIAMPHFRPGRHLGIFRFPSVSDERLDRDAEASAGTVLTKRERQVLTLVAVGDTGVHIAHRLCISPATVATHVTNALIKLGARNRAHGIAIALQTGELELAADAGLTAARSPKA